MQACAFPRSMVVLTDLLDRQMALQGELVMASLVDGYAVVKERTEPLQ